MNYALLAEWVEESTERLVAMGFTREVVKRELEGAEWAFMQDATQTKRDDQLLLNLERYGTRACMERYGVSDRTLRDRKKEAINRRAIRHMAAA